jgi:hypothetical protein
VFGVVHGAARSCDVLAGWSLRRSAGRLRLEPDRRSGVC